MDLTEGIVDLTELKEEHIKSYRKLYRLKNIDKIKEKAKKYYEKNAEEIKEQGKNYYENNKDKKHAYYLKNKAKILLNAKEKYMSKKMENLNV